MADSLCHGSEYSEPTYRIRSFPVGEAPVLTHLGVQKLEQHIADFRPSLVVVDPVTYFLGVRSGCTVPTRCAKCSLHWPVSQQT